MDYVEMENNQLKQCGVHTGHVAAPGGQCVFRALPALARERGLRECWLKDKHSVPRIHTYFSANKSLIDFIAFLGRSGKSQVRHE